jgi:hypothetical protein
VTDECVLRGATRRAGARRVADSLQTGRSCNGVCTVAFGLTPNLPLYRVGQLRATWASQADANGEVDRAAFAAGLNALGVTDALQVCVCDVRVHV